MEREAPKLRSTAALRALAAALLLTLAVAAAALPPAEAQALTVKTDKREYLPGEPVTVSGTARPGSLVALQLLNPAGATLLLVTVKADADGFFTKAFRLPEDAAEGGYTLVASQPDARETLTFQVARGPLLLQLTLTPEKAVYSQETLTITVTANRPIQDAPAVTVAQEGQAAIPVALTRTAVNQWSGAYAIVAGADGPATVRAEAADILGQRVKAEKSFTVDTTPPVVTITAPRSTFEAAIKVSGTVNDPTVRFIDLQLDAQPPQRVPVLNLAWSADVVLPTAGSHTLTATGRDAAGNQATVTTTVTLTVAAGSMAVSLATPTAAPPGQAATIWIHTTVGGEPVTPTSLTGVAITPDGREVELPITAVRPGLAKATLDIRGEGAYTVLVEADWHGVRGSALATIQASRPLERTLEAGLGELRGGLEESRGELAQTLGQMRSQIAESLGESRALLEEARRGIDSLLTLLIVATGFSVAAAAAAAFAVVQITRRLVLK